MKASCLTLALMGSILCCPSVRAQLPNQVSVLRGLATLNVDVQKVSEDAKRDGLNAGQIQTDVELRLRRAGIKVSPSDPRLFPRLFVRIEANKTDEGDYLYEISLELLMVVDRDISAPCKPGLRRNLVLGIVWVRGGHGTLAAGQLEREIRNRIGDMTDRFVNDFLAANQSR